MIRWLNKAAEDIAGDQRGVQFSQVFAPESRSAARTAFASKVAGPRVSTVYDAVMLTKDGTPVKVEISSVAVMGKTGIIGVFGTVNVEEEPEIAPRRPMKDLTPRQAAVLAYLARGYSTDDMAKAMGVSRETVRNHVRGLLRALGVHSRLEAVTTAHMRGLV